LFDLVFQGILFLSQKEIGNPLLGSSSILSKNIFTLFPNSFTQFNRKRAAKVKSFFESAKYFLKKLEKNFKNHRRKRMAKIIHIPIPT